MTRRKLLFTGVGATTVAVAGLAATAGPGEPRRRAITRTVPVDEVAQTIEAMRPPKRTRPVIAVVAQNGGTETTDLVVPYGVLAESNAAEVLIVAPEDRPIRLRPGALTIEPHLSFAAFERAYPDGADYVVVPKIENADFAPVVEWILAQHALGATIVGICSGAKTLSAAGLLEGRRATGHWYDLDELRRDNPTMEWMRDRRYVADRGVVTTTGVSASLPASLALVQAFAGIERAMEVARTLGVDAWTPEHDSSAFHLDRRSKHAAIANRYRFWKRETYAIPVTEGVDEISLAFAADAWSRTFRSEAFAIGTGGRVIETRRGMRLVPDAAAPARANDLEAPRSTSPALALPDALDGITARYGADTAAFVALQLELAWTPSLED